MRFLSVCSGIEAASVAFAPLGWKAAAFSEIEPFPSAVLAHHYPDTPNLGNMTKHQEWSLAPIGLVCGGTPCQAFSVAGQRRSMDDERGNLSLTFCRIADQFDPEWVLWENVPGVLSTHDNAFGCFLAELVGADEPFDAPGGKWPKWGVVTGPKRTAAWRVLDAQFFGVAQRRRRVFVLASRGSRDWRSAAALFPVGESVHWNSAPSREAGQATAQCLTTGTGKRYDPETETILPHGGLGVARSLRAEGFDASEDGTGRGTPLVPVETKDVRYAYYSHDYANDRITDVSGINPALTARDTASGNLNVAVPVAYGIRTANTSSNGWGIQEECTHTLDCAQGVAVAFQERGRTDGPSLEIGGDVAYALTAPNGGGRAQERNVLTPAMQVRRLTPTEAERLQGFPDNYTAIPWRKKPASECPDGPRYRALGNSWAIPCVSWIGERIARQINSTTTSPHPAGFFKATL